MTTGHGGLIDEYGNALFMADISDETLRYCEAYARRKRERERTSRYSATDSLRDKIRGTGEGFWKLLRREIRQDEQQRSLA